MKTLALDFDGVLHSHRSPWVASGIIPDDPTEGAQAFIAQALQVFDDVVVFSCRAEDEEGVTAIKEWLDEHGFPELEVTHGKPKALVYIDDRGYRFEGTWPDPQDLLDLWPWNRA